MIAHFEVLIEHAEKLKFQADIRGLTHQGSRAILGLAVFGDPDQLLIGDLSTNLAARLLGPVSENIVATDRGISFLEI